MKKLILAVAALAMCASASVAADYNRVGISYNNDHYGYNKDLKTKDFDGFSLNGIGIDYRHGFGLGEKPMFIETGASFNFNFGSPTTYESESHKEITKYQNMNLLVPVNFVYKFTITDDFSIAPYAGINFKLNLVSKSKEKGEYFNAPEDNYEDKDWTNWYSDKEDKGVGKNQTWNRFQMGWQIGVGFQYKPFYLGLQYGTDFIPAYSHKFENNRKPRINVGSLRVSLAYCF